MAPLSRSTASVSAAQSSRTRFFASAKEIRAWLESNHGNEPFLVVGFQKKNAGIAGLTYSEALDAALCFGWIDSVRKGIDADRYSIRFSPRKPNSIWSRVNIKRAEELIARGLMHPAGLKAFAAKCEGGTKRYSYEQGELELPEKYLTQLRKNQQAWLFFQKTPAGYQRKAAGWIMSAKQSQTQERRLERLISASAQNERLDKAGRS